MKTIESHMTADLFFQIHWSSPMVQHTDAYCGHQVNLWRDLLPSQLGKELQGKGPGDTVRIKLCAEQLIEASDRQDLRTIARRQFDSSPIRKAALLPRSGRFYPKGRLKEMTGIFAANITPFRCLQTNKSQLIVDLGHPLCGKEIDLTVTVGTIRPKLTERGGSLCNWGERITQGVGMQARWQDQPTDFFSDNPFERRDKAPDSDFYASPRMVQHIDDGAMDVVRNIHAQFVASEMSVLDLMSSWQTHLNEGTKLNALIGLGLNKTELQRNKMLNSYRLHDLNAQADLPFNSHLFDTVLCSMSVEYLIHPLTVFREVARVLKPGGCFVVTFSNRWFESKTIGLWTELHEFERIGLVLEYFRHDQLFEDLHSYSFRGLARPGNDKYYGQLPYSDPVYAVWGRRSNG